MPPGPGPGQSWQTRAPIPRAENAIFDRSLNDGPVTTVELEPHFEVELDDLYDEQDVPDDSEADPQAPRTTELLLDSDTFSRLQEEAIESIRPTVASQATTAPAQ